MKNNWQQHLTDKGAIFSTDGVTQYFTANPFPNAEGLCVTDLGGLATYDLEGPDAYKFLQGQITQDVKLLERQYGFIADHCTPKGRVLGTLMALPVSADHVRLMLPTDNAESVITNLRKYLVFSKARLNPVNERQALFFCGAQAGEQAQVYFDQLPDQPWQVTTSNSGLCVKLSENGYLLSLETEPAIKLINTAGAQLGGWRHWQKFLIEQGIAWVDGSNREQFTPHQINHQFINAISFKKGCYTGQEVVARMHYKATPKSHLYGYTLESVSAPTLGCAIKTEQATVGKVLWCAQAGPRQWLLLAETKIESAESHVHLDTETGEKLSRFELPYAINK